ncbi:MAG: putative Quercetin 2,3-dioxygenase [Frankiales bacterium]|nr:putative Quercetin 2,3-dioxygenase [Frankiales bacterium]
MTAGSQQVPVPVSIDVRRAADRFNTRIDWLDSRHSFSFGRHYDPANTHFGLLLVSNDDVVAPGSGFSTHPHRDMEIVTWVLEGQLAHQDSHGHSGLITPGLAQRMSAGSGTLHSEINAAGDSPVRFVQMWVMPDTESVTPSYDQLDITAELSQGGLVPVASGRGHDAAISIRQEGAVLWAARLQPGELVQLPDAPYMHVFVAKGPVALEGAGDLAQGDAVRLTGAGGPTVVAHAASEILVWEMDSAA